MRFCSASSLTAAGVATVFAMAPLAQGDQHMQWISLDAVSGDGSVSGHAQITATAEHGGFHLVGEVTSHAGCVVLKSKTHYWYRPDSVTEIARVCGTERTARFDRWTRQRQVVLTADIGLGYDSRTVTLTG